MTLYEQNQADWDKIALYRPSVAVMSQHFDAHIEMAQALGYTATVTSKWIQRRGGVSLESERRAAKWLERNARDAAPLLPAPDTNGVLLLVVCPNVATQQKALRLLAVLGCEASEV